MSASLVETLGGAYVAGVALSALLAFYVWEVERSPKTGARIALASPVWPATLAYGIFAGLRKLIEVARHG